VAHHGVRAQGVCAHHVINRTARCPGSHVCIGQHARSLIRRDCFDPGNHLKPLPGKYLIDFLRPSKNAFDHRFEKLQWQALFIRIDSNNVVSLNEFNCPRIPLVASPPLPLIDEIRIILLVKAVQVHTLKNLVMFEHPNVLLGDMRAQEIRGESAMIIGTDDKPNVVQ
jgi:hypothetical protein